MSTQRSMIMFGMMLAAGTAAGCMGGDDSGPATCNDAKSTYNVSTDGPQTLYLGGDKTMPWQAFCVGMASDSPQEFIELPQFDGAKATNFSEFSQAASRGVGSDDLAAMDDGFKITTHYEKVRIDPVALTIDITNKTFTHTDQVTTVTGALVSIPLHNLQINYMPYGVAMQCGAVLDGGVPVSTNANISLTGLPFELVDDQMCTSPGNNAVQKDLMNPTKIVSFQAQGLTSEGVMACSRASVHCLPDPTANGQVEGQTTIPLRYTSPTTGFGF